MIGKTTQFGLANAFLPGLYDDEFSIFIITEYGNVSHGTFNTIDGEMIVLDGIAFGADAEGKTLLVALNHLTHIATVTHFKAEE